jgi:aryl-alcohol dehydrogenase-like predicted oxidoreductase
MLSPKFNQDFWRRSSLASSGKANFSEPTPLVEDQDQDMNKYLEIDKTDLKVSRIGLGTANAGLAWDGNDAFRIFDAYLDRGGNLIDSARIYSDWVQPEIGRSERVIGDWLRNRGRHDDIIMMTKGGHPRLDSMTLGRLSRKEVETDLDLSLRALSLDCIDIYCYHRDDMSRSVEELIETMESFVRAGKIRYYACSNWSTERMKEADSFCNRKGYRGFVLNQALYNYGSSAMNPYPDKTMVTVDANMLEYHSSNLKNVLAAYMTLCSGFFHNLSGKGEQAVAESPYCTRENLELYKKIASVAADNNTGITQVLVAFVLTRKPDMLALIGARNLELLEAAMDTVNVDFAGVSF